MVAAGRTVFPERSPRTARPQVAGAHRDANIRAFLVWSRFPFWTIEPRPKGRSSRCPICALQAEMGLRSATIVNNDFMRRANRRAGRAGRGGGCRPRRTRGATRLTIHHGAAIGLLPAEIRPLFEQHKSTLIERAIDPEHVAVAASRPGRSQPLSDLDWEGYRQVSLRWACLATTLRLVAKVRRETDHRQRHRARRVEEMHATCAGL